MSCGKRTRLGLLCAAVAALVVTACDEDGGSAPPFSTGSVPMSGGAVMEPLPPQFGGDACRVGETRACACAEPNMEGVQECIFDFQSPTSGIFAECKDCVAVEPRGDACRMGMTRPCTCDGGEAGRSFCVFDDDSPTQGTFSECRDCSDELDGGT